MKTKTRVRARVVSAASRPIERECRDGDACSLKDFKPDQAAGVNSITVILCVIYTNTLRSSVERRIKSRREHQRPSHESLPPPTIVGVTNIECTCVLVLSTTS